MNLLAPLHSLAGWLRHRNERNLGRWGEERAHRWLRSHGFTVVARNWRPPQGGGEIDLIAWEKETLVFVEVKARTSDDSSAPERGISQDKMLALRRAARDYIRRAGAEDKLIRFDVITFTGEALQYFRDAFSLNVSL